MFISSTGTVVRSFVVMVDSAMEISPLFDDGRATDLLGQGRSIRPFKPA
jgi:hypothetical protein